MSDATVQNAIFDLKELVDELLEDDSMVVPFRNDAYQINTPELPAGANEMVKKVIRARVLKVLSPRPRKPREA